MDLTTRVCTPPANKRPGESLAAPAAARQGVCTSPDDIVLWPCGTWCFRDEVGYYAHMSDDSRVISVDSPDWLAFIKAPA
jgi:hypothetical protein